MVKKTKIFLKEILNPIGGSNFGRVCQCISDDDDNIVELLVKGNTISDNHFMNFRNKLMAIWYPLNILMSSNRREFLLLFLG